MVGRGSTNQGDFTPLGRAFLQAAPPLFICMLVSARRLGPSSIFSFNPGGISEVSHKLILTILIYQAFN